jgi:uncharacterized protein YegL
MRLPVYLVIDTSASLSMVIDDLNAALRSFVDHLRSDPLVMNIVRVSIISFSNDAEALVTMAELGQFVLPKLRASGGTDYGLALHLLRQAITNDVNGLRAEDARILRPLVFFISDGQPLDREWIMASAELHDPSFRYRPTVIAIGYGSADPVILRTVAGPRGQVFIVAAAVPLPRAVESIFEGLTRSLQATVTSSQSQQFLLVMTCSSSHA